MVRMEGEKYLPQNGLEEPVGAIFDDIEGFVVGLLDVHDFCYISAAVAGEKSAAFQQEFGRKFICIFFFGGRSCLVQLFIIQRRLFRCIVDLANAAAEVDIFQFCVKEFL